MAHLGGYYSISMTALRLSEVIRLSLLVSCNPCVSRLSHFYDGRRFERTGGMGSCESRLLATALERSFPVATIASAHCEASRSK